MTETKYDITETAEVTELRAAENANSYLKIGWKLLHTHTYDYGDPVARHQKTVYVLGWPNSEGAAKHPEVSEWLEKSNR